MALALVPAGAASAVGGATTSLGGTAASPQVSAAWPEDSTSPGRLGQSAADPWIVGPGSRLAQAGLPGGVGSVRLEVGPDDVVTAASSTQLVTGEPLPIAIVGPDPAKSPDSINPATVGCLREAVVPPSPAVTVGLTVSCASKQMTLTFDRPTTDPVIWLGSTANIRSHAIPDPAALCTASWYDADVAAVDGAPASSRRISPVSTSQSQVVRPGWDVPLSWQTTPAGCVSLFGDPRGVPAVQIDGVVTSVTIDLDLRAKVMRIPADLAGVTMYDVAEPGVGLAVSADVVDLATRVGAPATVVPGGTYEWTVDVSNLSLIGSHGLVVTGVVPEAVVDARLVAAPDGCVLSGRDLSCTRAPEGWTVEQSTTISTLAELTGADPRLVGEVLDGGASLGTITLQGTAPTTSGMELVTSASVSGVDSDLDLANNVDEAVTTVDAATWAVSKSVATIEDRAYPRPGDVLSYTVVVESTVGDVDGVTLTDDLSDVLAYSGLVPGSVRLTVGDSPAVHLDDPTVEAPVLVAGPFRLVAGTTATLEYDVVIHGDSWSEDLVNTVMASGSSTPQTCASETSDPGPACTTSTTTTARLDLLKQGQVNGQLVGLDGSDFEVLSDVDGALGEVLASPTASPVAIAPGAFEIAGIDPGTYWLRETVAPPGHELLAAAVRFVVAPDGTVTLASPASAPQVSVTGGTITVTDAPSFQMPETGSAGAGRLVTVGLLLLAGAVVATATLGPRTHPLLLTALRKRRR